MDRIIISIVFLLIASAFFSATETAYSSMSKFKLKNMLNNGNHKAEKVLKLSENYTKLISTILIGNNIVNILVATLFTVLFIHLVNEFDGPAISTGVSTILLLVFCEVTPKTIAKKIPEQTALFFYNPISFFVALFTPFTFVFDKWQSFINLFFKQDVDDTIGSEELLTMVEEAKIDGGIENHEATLLTRAIEFNELDVKDILKPRIDVIAIEEHSTIDEVEKVFNENNYSRIPVYQGSIDNIVGILQEKDFYYAYYRQKDNVKLTDIMKEVVYTSSHVKISTLLRELQKSKSHMAVVLDEYGGTEGIVTMEDVLEEIVGEIYDEHDEIEILYKKINENTYLVKGEMELKELEEMLSVDIMDEEFDFVTVSGWVIYTLDKIPVRNDRFRFDQFELTVIECDDKKVKQVKIEKVKQPS